MDSPLKKSARENDTFIQVQDKPILNKNFEDEDEEDINCLNFCYTLTIDKIYTCIGKEKDNGDSGGQCNTKLNKDNSASDETMYRRCLCDTIFPIIVLGQIVGIIPLTLTHPKGEDGRRSKTCLMDYSWRCIGSLVNAFLTVCYVAALPFSYSEIRDRIGAIFQGTDLYAFTFQTLAILLQTTAVLIAGRVYKKKFSKGWKALNDVYHEMCDSAGDLSRIKIASYVVTIVVVVESTLFFFINLWTYIKSAGIFDSCISIYVGTIYIQLSTVVPYILSSVFFFVCLLIRSNFLKISAMISTVVAKQKNTKLAAQIDSLRVLHEQLCSAVTDFEEFFGIQVLLTLCVCCFTVTTGAYAVILQGEDMSSYKGKEMTAAWGTQLYCATVFILLIVIAGQLVSNSAAASAPVLNAIPLTGLDEPCQKQITAFLHKISAYPVNMSAMKITTISTTFLASAATNITTYLLVLMQFKLTIESKPYVVVDIPSPNMMYNSTSQNISDVFNTEPNF